MKKYRVMYSIILISAMGYFIWKNEKEPLALLLFLIVLPILLKLLGAWDARHLEVVISGAPSCSLGKGMPIRLTAAGKHITFTGRVRAEVLFHNLLTGEQSAEAIDLLYEAESFGAQFLHIGKECGKICLEIKSIYCVDYLGLTRNRIKTNLQVEFLVYPKLLARHDLMNKPQAGPALDTLLVIPKKGNERDEILDIREYVEGDSMSRVHWKLSAKWEKLMVAEYGDGGREKIVLILDIVAQTERDTRNELMSLLGSVGNQLLQEGLVYCVAMAFGGRIVTHKVTNEGTFWEMMTNMVCTPLQNNRPVELFRQSDLAVQFSKILCFTDSPDSQMPDVIIFEAEKLR